MTVEEAILARVSDDVDVAARVGTRVHQLKLPETPTLPAVRVQLIDDPETKHLRGPDGTKAARVQLDAYEDENAIDPYGSVTEIAAYINASLVVEPFVISGSPTEVRVHCCERKNRRVLYEADELRLIRVFQDYIVWYREVTN